MSFRCHLTLIHNLASGQTMDELSRFNSEREAEQEVEQEVEHREAGRRIFWTSPSDIVRYGYPDDRTYFYVIEEVPA